MEQLIEEKKSIFNQKQYLIMLVILLQFISGYPLFKCNIPFLNKKSNITAKEQGSKEKKVSPSEKISLQNKTITAADQNKDLFEYQIKKSELIYNQIIVEASEMYDVDKSTVKAIIMAESGFTKEVVSHRGAGGLMQLMPETAKSLGVKDVLDPEENIHAGVRYYKTLLNRFNGNETLALAAYNAGARNVRKYKGVPPFRETQAYIRKVLEYRRIYKQGTGRQETSL